MGITREDIENDRVRQRLREEVARGHEHSLLSEEEFEQTRIDVLREFEAHDELWIFGYGSLIWNPTFHFVESAVADLRGHARKFCLWAKTGRGDPKRPGLWLGLDDGENCVGLAFRVDNALRDYETLMLWRREMISGAYQPRVLPVLIDGQEKPCICLLANKDHDRYAGPLPQDQIVQAIATASGHLGTCSEYLFNLVDKLESVGVYDADLHDLSREVRDYQRRIGESQS